MLLKRAIFGVLALVAGVFVYILYNTYDSGRVSRAGLGEAVSAGNAAPSESRTRTQPAESAAAEPGAAMTEPQTAGSAGPLVSKPQTAPGGDVPRSEGDSLHAQPPNGMTFAGKGPYQLYRQGELTWRLNTETGATCVIFASQAQWRRPEVYRSGCRGR